MPIISQDHPRLPGSTRVDPAPRCHHKEDEGWMQRIWVTYCRVTQRALRPAPFEFTRGAPSRLPAWGLAAPQTFCALEGFRHPNPRPSRAAAGHSQAAESARIDKREASPVDYLTYATFPTYRLPPTCHLPATYLPTYPLTDHVPFV